MARRNSKCFAVHTFLISFFNKSDLITEDFMQQNYMNNFCASSHKGEEAFFPFEHNTVVWKYSLYGEVF